MLYLWVMHRFMLGDGQILYLPVPGDNNYQLIVKEIPMSQSCGLCLKPYDYFESSATVICAQNHLACKKCVGEMIQSNSKCPYCYQPVINPNNQLGWGANQNYVQPQPYPNNAYWQPVPNQGPIVQPHPIIANNQGFNAQPYVVHPNAGNRGKPGKFCGLSILFLIAAVALIITRIQMNSCTFWGAVDCGNNYGGSYCCDYYCYDIFDSSCGYLIFYENIGLEIFVTAVGAMCAGLSLSFFVLFLRKRKLQQLQALNNRYVAMAN